MKDFIYYAPTQVVFGALSEDKTGKLVKQYSGTKVLVHYGGQSAERSGLLDKICRALEAEGIAYVKLGGVVPNPRLSKVKRTGRRRMIDAGRSRQSRPHCFSVYPLMRMR